MPAASLRINDALKYTYSRRLPTKHVRLRTAAVNRWKKTLTTPTHPFYGQRIVTQQFLSREARDLTSVGGRDHPPAGAASGAQQSVSKAYCCAAAAAATASRTASVLVYLLPQAPGTTLSENLRIVYISIYFYIRSLHFRTYWSLLRIRTVGDIPNSGILSEVDV